MYRGLVFINLLADADFYAVRTAISSLMYVLSLAPYYGDIDLIVSVDAPDSASFSDTLMAIRKVPGIASTDTRLEVLDF